MMIHLTDQEFARLKIARETQKYGHLQSWKELFLYQRYCDAKKDQIQEIATWARRKNRGEKITLPLMFYGKQESI